MKYCRAAGLLIFAGTFVIVGCKKSTNQARGADNHNAHWSYGEGEGPDHWANLDKDYKQCAYGHKQSPINIDTGGQHATAAEHKIQFAYNQGEPDVENNGHTIKISFEKAGSFHFDGKPHALKQFHFHTPSEHTIDGKRFPMEMHLVHQSADDKFLVVGILFETGTEHELLSVFDDDIPRQELKLHLHKKIDLSSLVNDDAHFYHYQGSLTTPPCTEGVRWLVQKEHAFASAEQIAAIESIEGHNARPTQAKFERKIEEQ